MSRPTPRRALLLGAALTAAASGCTVYARPIPATSTWRPQAAQPTQPAPAQPFEAPPPEPPRVDAAFQQAVDDYLREVRALRFASEYEQPQRVRIAIERLADAIEQAPVPIPGRRSPELSRSAEQIRNSAARIGFEGGPYQADSRAVRDALNEALVVLERLAERGYGASPGLRWQLDELGARVEAVQPWTPIRRQDAQIVAALEAAGGALGSMASGLDQGEPYPRDWRRDQRGRPYQVP